MNRAEIEDRIRKQIKLQGKARSTADAYVAWVFRYLDFCKSRTLAKSTAESAAKTFLTYLAEKEHVSPNTQNQAFSGICYFYREILDRPLVDVSALRSKRPKTTKVVCDESDLAEIFSHLSGLPLLACSLLYGAGLRRSELALRIKDIDFNRNQLHIHGAKGNKSRVVQFPESLHAGVKRQIESVRLLWRHDVETKQNGVSLPHAWGRKSPSSRLDFSWFYLFSAQGYSRCPDTQGWFRHHRDFGVYGKALRKAVKDSGVTKRVTLHSLRHCWATHSLEGGVPIHFVQELLGHESIETTALYTHVRKDAAAASKSPMESTEMLAACLNGTVKQSTESKPKLRIYAG